jgi:hypothetical protein
MCGDDRRKLQVPSTRSQAAANAAGSTPIIWDRLLGSALSPPRNHDRHAGPPLADHWRAGQPSIDKHLVGRLGVGWWGALPALAEHGDRRWPRVSHTPPSGRCHSPGSRRRETVRTSADECIAMITCARSRPETRSGRETRDSSRGSRRTWPARHPRIDLSTTLPQASPALTRITCCMCLH